jgi:hypothetical protein
MNEASHKQREVSQEEQPANQRHPRRPSFSKGRRQEGISEGIEAIPNGEQPDSRHTTHPPVACLGRSFLITNLSKESSRVDAVLTAPPGGRFWHGFAVRRPPVGRGGRGMSFGRVSTEGRAAEIDPMQTPLATDIEGL